MEENYRRMGYMTEAMTKTLNCLDIEDLYLSIRKDNKPSIGLADKLGFQKTKSESNKYIYKKKA